MKKNWLYPGLRDFPFWSRKTFKIMKISVFLFIAGIISMYASNSYSQITRLSMDLREVAVGEVLTNIEDQSEFYFLYSNKLVDVKRKVSFHVKNKPVKNILDHLFADTDVRYVIFDRQIILSPEEMLKKTFEQQNALLQEIVVTGKVTDEDGNSLPGVNIAVKGTLTGTISDANGNYRIEIYDSNTTLAFSFIGYRSQDVEISGRSVINIILIEEAIGMDQVVVVGYGTQKKSLVTGAISSVKAEEIATVSVTRVEEAFQGRIAGVYVLPNSGTPGSSMRVRIRGAGSNGNAEPLYIVDGIRSADISYLDPSEVASIEILKDAASSAIYGAEGANGVVIITTKTGRKNSKTNISYSGQFGIQSIGRMMKVMNAEQYGTYIQEAGVSKTSAPTQEEWSAAGEGTNWFKEVFKPAPMLRNSLSITGGTEKSSYLVSASMFKQQGIAGQEKAEYDRYTFRLNSDHEIKSWLNIGNRLSYSKVNRSLLPEDSEFSGILYSALRMDPITPLTYSGALPAHAQSALDQGYTLLQDENGDYYGVSKYLISAIQPVAQIQSTHVNRVENQLTGSVFAVVDVIKGLKFNSIYGIDYKFSKTHQWTQRYWAGSQAYNLYRRVYDTNTDMFNWQFENYLTYTKKINDHDFTLMAGTSAISNSYNRLGGESTGMFREEDKFAYHDFTPDVGNLINGSIENNTLASFYSRLTYNYKNKYIFNATIRRDGSSLLPPDNRWGTFPSVSLGWVASNENFFQSNVIDFFRFRVSWGQNGSLSNIINGGWASAITTQNINYANSAGQLIVGAEPNAISNKELTWETGEQFDLGMDLRFFNNKIRFTADYFNKITQNLLTPGSPPGFAGFPIPSINGGNIVNKGFEFELGYTESETVLKYDISINATAIKNEVTYLNPQYPRIEGAEIHPGWIATAFEVGYPVWYFRGYKTDGIFQTQEEITEYITNNELSGYTPEPGDPRIIDVNEDGLISPDDQTYIGSPHPKFMYGARLGLNYKGFDFLLFVQGQVGNDVLLGFLRTDAYMNNKPAFLYTDRWTGPGTTNSWFRSDVTNELIYQSDLMVFDASYLRIRQLQIGYILSNRLVSKLKLENLRLFISLDNYFTFTKYPGVDPEIGSESRGNGLGIDRVSYPIARKTLVGITLNF